MTDLTTSIKHFASLNRTTGPTWSDATKRKAPHKPLLLQVLQTWRDSCAVITSRQIAADPNVLGFPLALAGRSIIPLFWR